MKSLLKIGENFMGKIIKYFEEPSNIILYLMNKNILWWLNDKTYLKLKYKLVIM